MGIGIIEHCPVFLIFSVNFAEFCMPSSFCSSNFQLFWFIEFVWQYLHSLNAAIWHFIPNGPGICIWRCDLELMLLVMEFDSVLWGQVMFRITRYGPMRMTMRDVIKILLSCWVKIPAHGVKWSMVVVTFSCIGMLVCMLYVWNLTNVHLVNLVTLRLWSTVMYKLLMDLMLAHQLWIRGYLKYFSYIWFRKLSESIQ